MPLNILQLTDPHIYDDPDRLLYDVNTNQALRSVVARICSEDAVFDLVVVTGDLVHDAGDIAYQTLITLLEPLNLPCYLIPGNHDQPHIMREVFNQMPFLWLDRLERQGWQLLFLNTQAQGQIGGTLSEKEYKQFCAHLDSCDLPTVIFMHHPALPVNSTWLDRIALQDAVSFLEVLNTYPQVKAVVNGHVHQEFEYISERGVHFYGTPSTCAQFKPKVNAFAVDELAPGWRVLKLANNGEVESYIKRL